MKGFIFLLFLCINISVFAQKRKDSIQTIQQVQIIKRLPVTKQIIDVQKDLAVVNQGQDLPFLLKNQPSVEFTSDAGNGIGYTGLRIRGVDGSRINVMIDGVPFNDSESQTSYFVDIPDITSSSSQIVIQRGVGTSTNGVAAFGASVDVLLKDPAEAPYLLTQNSVGSFGTYKNSIEAGTGKLWNGKLKIMGRYSRIHSDGYIDRAFSDLNSYNLLATYQQGNSKLKLVSFNGREKTYQAWNGISKEQYETNPRYNSAGEIYDLQGNVIGFYKNETDNYRQSHNHLTWEQQFHENWKLNTTLFYTYGVGFYENYESNQNFADYGLPAAITGTDREGDLIRRKYMKNDFYGLNSSLTGITKNWIFNFGATADQYLGKHYGRVMAGPQLLSDLLPFEFYNNHAEKNEVSGFAKALFRKHRFEFFGDLQMRHILYWSKVNLYNISDAPVFHKQYNFFNPKVGLNYHFNSGTLYFSFAVAHREPVRSDLQDNPEIKPEQLNDWELGYHGRFGAFSFNTDLYYMAYRDQLVLSGKISDTGATLHQNSGKSFRRGLEVVGNYIFSKKFQTNLNLTVSQNKNLNYFADEAGKLIDYGDTDIAASPNFIGNLSFQYHPFENFSTTYAIKAVSSQYINNTQTAEYRLDAYTVSNLSASYRIKFNRVRLIFDLLINNLFDAKYTNYGVDYGAPYYFAQAGINFMFGATLKFQ